MSEPKKIGEIKMRTPNGGKSVISVDRNDKGSVGIHFSRSSEGEALMWLNAQTARELGALLLKAGKMPLPPPPSGE